MANYELIGLNEAGPDLRAPTASDTGTVAGAINITGTATIQTLTVGLGAGSISSNTAVGVSALAANTTGTKNSAFGDEALQSNEDGVRNSAFGETALQFNVGGDRNSAFGVSALEKNVSGLSNSGFGDQALFTNVSGDYNTAVGYTALWSNTANNNTAVGAYSLYDNGTGNYNSAFGTSTLENNTTGSGNTAFGTYALFTNRTSSSSTAVGYDSLGLSTGNTNTAIGYQAGHTVTTGSNLTLIGYNAAPSAVTATNEMTFGDTNVTLNRFNGTVTAEGLTVAQGVNATATTLRIENTDTTINAAETANAIEFYTNDTSSVGTGVTGKISHVCTNAGTTYDLTFSTYNATSLSEAMRINSNGDFLVGKTVASSATEGFEAKPSGFFAATRTNNVVGVLNRLSTDGDILDFRKAGTTVGSIGVDSGDNLFIEGSAGSTHSGLQFGTSAVLPHKNGTTANAVVDLGAAASQFKDLYLSGTVTSAGLVSKTLGLNNFVAGSTAGDSILAGGNNNTLVGDLAGTAITTGDDNVAVGYAALDAASSGKFNTAVGKSAGGAVTTGIQNTLIGGVAGDALTDADYNVAVGYLALSNDTLGSRSVAVGYGSLATQNFTSATNTYNVAVGHNAGNGITTGIQNTFIGGLAGDANTTANNNTAVGYNSLNDNISGTQNVALGMAAGSTVTTGSNLTLVGYNAQPSAVDTTNEVTLGDTNVATFRCQVALTILSDERDKAQIAPINECLDFVNDLSVKSFIMSERNSEETQGELRTGLLAQDLLAVIEKHNIAGTDDLVKSDNPDRLEVTTSDLIFPLIKAVQELSQQVKQLQQKGE